MSAQGRQMGRENKAHIQTVDKLIDWINAGTRTGFPDQITVSKKQYQALMIRENNERLIKDWRPLMQLRAYRGFMLKVLKL